jgi:tight adherence protein C
MSMQLLPVMLAAAFFLGIIALGLMALLLVQRRQRVRVQRRLDIDTPLATEVSAREGLMQELAEHGQKVESLIATDGETPRLLVQAGWRSADARYGYYLSQLLCPLVAILFVGVAWLLAGDDARGLVYLMALLIALFGGLLLPRIVLRKRAAARRGRISQEVPLFIHLLVLLFEAGLSTRQAFASLVREGSGTLPELGGEFAMVLRQLDAGADTAEVLKNLGDVLEVPDLSNVLSVLRQMDRYGGEIREPLLETLQVLEERRSMDLREKVNLVSGRMTVVMVLFFFPALLIFVAGPAFVSIIKALGEVGGG